MSPVLTNPGNSSTHANSSWQHYCSKYVIRIVHDVNTNLRRAHLGGRTNGKWFATVPCDVSYTPVLTADVIKRRNLGLGWRWLYLIPKWLHSFLCKGSTPAKLGERSWEKERCGGTRRRPRSLLELLPKAPRQVGLEIRWREVSNPIRIPQILLAV